MNEKNKIRNLTVDASISGIAGLGHICIGVGMILYFLMLKKTIAERK